MVAMVDTVNESGLPDMPAYLGAMLIYQTVVVVV